MAELNFNSVGHVRGKNNDDSFQIVQAGESTNRNGNLKIVKKEQPSLFILMGEITWNSKNINYLFPAPLSSLNIRKFKFSTKRWDCLWKKSKIYSTIFFLFALPSLIWWDWNESRNSDGHFSQSKWLPSSDDSHINYADESEHHWIMEIFTVSFFTFFTAIVLVYQCR